MGRHGQFIFRHLLMMLVERWSATLLRSSLEAWQVVLTTSTMLGSGREIRMELQLMTMPKAMPHISLKQVRTMERSHMILKHIGTLGRMLLLDFAHEHFATCNIMARARFHCNYLNIL